MNARVRALFGVCLSSATALAQAQVSVLPAAPQMLDPVRVAILRTGPFLFDPASVRVGLAEGKFTVHLGPGVAFSPAPPPSTFEVLLGQLPMGTYQVEAILDSPTPSTLGTAAFTVGPRSTTVPVYTDLWWTASESGWGLNIVQHPSDTLFATLFIYEPSPSGGAGPARWYVMPALTRAAAGSNFYGGPVYRTTGPQVLDSFDPTMVTRTPVGTAGLAVFGRDAAGLSVTIDGRKVTKELTRQPF